MDDFFKELSKPFPVELISWRAGPMLGDKSKTIPLAYIDARDVMERLDAVAQPQWWQCTYTTLGDKTVCNIGLKLGGEWVWKADGAGDTDMEAVKGGFSDAFKRAAVRWGIGRYLYDVKAGWVEVEPRGKSYAIKEKEYAGLRQLLHKFDTPVVQPSTLREDTAIVAKQIEEASTLEAMDNVVRFHAGFISQLKDKQSTWHEALIDKISAKRLLLEKGK